MVKNVGKRAPKPESKWAKDFNERDPVCIAFAKRLKSAAIHKGWRRADLAAASGLTRDHMSRYYNAISLPDEVSLGKLAKALEMEPHELLPNRAVPHDIVDVSQIARPLKIIADPNNPGMMWVSFNQLVPTKVALEIASMLPDDDASKPANRRSSRN